jgi:Family of unknown function (DUF6498)
MPVPPTPLDVANTVVRNLVPLGGILVFGWSATNILILYFVDTLLAMAVMFAGVMRYFMPPPKDEGIAARLNAEAGYVAGAVFITAFIAIPIGMPLVFIGAAANVKVGSIFADQSFRVGLVLQAIAAFWSCLGLYRALQTHTPEEIRLKRRFALVFLRWIVVIAATYTGFVFLFGPYAPFIFVAIYAGASIMIDVAPDKFLSAMPGGADDAEPVASTPRAAAPLPTFKTRRRDKRKR